MCRFVRNMPVKVQFYLVEEVFMSKFRFKTIMPDIGDRLVGRVESRGFNIVCVITICLLNIVWFLPLMGQGAIMGDDIGVFTTVDFGNRALWQEFLYQGSNRYRPIFELILNLYSRVFGNVYELYFLANIAVNMVLSVAIFFLIKRVTRGNFLFAASGVFLYVLAPFSYYQILQVIGVLESYSLLFLVLMMHELLSFWHGKRLHILSAVLFLTLLIFTHERYVVTAPWCVIIILCSSGTNWKEKIGYSILALMPMCLNIFLKEVVFGSRFMEGTAFEPIEFDVLRIISMFISSLATVVGLNVGPEYLNGFNFFLYPRRLKLLALAAVGLAFLLFFAYIVTAIIKEKDKKKRINELKLMFISVSGIGALILCSSVTIRVEMRWLYAPFVVYLMYLMYVVSKVKLNVFIRKVKWIPFLRYGCMAALLFVTLVINYPYQKQIDRIFFPKAMIISDNVYESTIDCYGENLADYKLYFVGNHEAEWAVGYPGRSIFDVYFDEQVDFTFVDSVDQIQADYQSIDADQRKPMKVFVVHEKLLTVQEVGAAQLDWP